jgi:hypothetical protein
MMITSHMGLPCWLDVVGLTGVCFALYLGFHDVWDPHWRSVLSTIAEVSQATLCVESPCLNSRWTESSARQCCVLLTGATQTYCTAVLRGHRGGSFWQAVSLSSPNGREKGPGWLWEFCSPTQLLPRCRTPPWDLTQLKPLVNCSR